MNKSHKTHSLTYFLPDSHCWKTPGTLETFGQSDMETWNDQQKDNEDNVDNEDNDDNGDNLMTLRKFLGVALKNKYLWLDWLTPWLSDPRDLWPLRHWSHFWQLRTTIITFTVTLQLRVTGGSIHNSCDVFLLQWDGAPFSFYVYKITCKWHY